MDEVKRNMIIGRIDYLKSEVEHGLTMIDSPINGKFWSGKVEAINGITGELNFLNKLLEDEQL